MPQDIACLQFLKAFRFYGGWSVITYHTTLFASGPIHAVRNAPSPIVNWWQRHIYNQPVSSCWSGIGRKTRWLNSTTLCQEPHPSKGSILALSLGNKFQKVKYYLGHFATEEKSFVHQETGRGFRDEAGLLVMGPQRMPLRMGSWEKADCDRDSNKT